MNYLIFYVVAFVLNIPFGFFRKPLSQKAKNRAVKFLIMMLLIHIPIPVVILLRGTLDIDRTVLSIVLSVSICILGQIFGSRIVPKLIPCRQNS